MIRLEFFRHHVCLFQVCSGNGKCKGSGTRKGNGKCSCNKVPLKKMIATCKFDKIRNMEAKSATNAVGIITKASEMKQSFCVHHATRYALILVIGSFVIEDMCAGLFLCYCRHVRDC